MAEKLGAGMVSIGVWLARRIRREAGQGLVEYALILALIAIIVIVALQFLQPQISNTLNTVSNSL
jgi:pilus assembly protein Flp/PilA